MSHLPLHLRAAGVGAASIAFIAAFEPNIALRYGPFIAAGVFLLANPARFRIGATEWALFTFLVWVAISQFWALYPERFPLAAMSIASSAAMFIGIRAAIRWGGTASFVVKAYATGCVIGLARTSLGWVEAGGLIRDGAGRITQAGDLNVNYVAYGSVAAFLLLVLSWRQVRTRRGRFATIVLLGILGSGIGATQTRGAQIGLLLLLAWLLVSRFGRPLKTITALSALVAIFVSFGWATNALALAAYGARSIDGLSGRGVLWEGARYLWGNNVLFGAGFGGVRAVTPGALPAHNLILGLGAEVGIVGLGIFLLFLYLSQTDRIVGSAGLEIRLGAILLTFLPILLTSSWEMFASAWVGIALLSQPISNALRVDQLSRPVNEVVTATSRN